MVFSLIAHGSTVLSFFFFNDTATTEIYTLSLHDALPISPGAGAGGLAGGDEGSFLGRQCTGFGLHGLDRKSTRLNSSHQIISYAVFCLKKKKKTNLQSRNDNPCLFNSSQLDDVAAVSTMT